MLKTVSQLIWPEQSSELDFNSWKEWQKRQYSLHYERCDLFFHYKSSRPLFKQPRESCIDKESYYWYSYCFGDFTCLIVEPSNAIYIYDYIKLLVDIYDVCKGMRRSITGDPIGITLLKKTISTGNLQPLHKHNFAQYNYDYSEIHAHTIAQYSLSTLLMRLLSHYLTFVSSYYGINGFAVDLSSCQRCLENRTFGEPKTKTIKTIGSKPVAIPNRISKSAPSEEIKPISWPYNKNDQGFFRCKNCQRVTEIVHGDFHVCLDCHSLRICSKCGNPAVVIDSDDKLPKCQIHTVL